MERAWKYELIQECGTSLLGGGASRHGPVGGHCSCKDGYIARNSAQFKAEAVQMVVQNDRPIAEVAKELQINDGTLGNWVKLY